MDIKEHDVIRLKDGREGTVIHTSPNHTDIFLVEFSTIEDNKQLEIKREDVDRIIWSES